jgi:hypothetical protein
MKRSGGVTAAAIVLFLGSGLLLLFMLLSFLGGLLMSSQLQLPPEARYGQLTGLVFYFVFAAWGIATGVGILQLRPWARISILVMSGVAICFCAFGALGLSLVSVISRQTPDLPPAAFTVVIGVGVAMLLVPVAIAIWWLVLFTRKRVIAEFLTRGTAPLAVAAASFEAIPATAVPQPAAAPAGISVASLPAASTPQIPLSVRVIAIFLIVGAAFTLVNLPFMTRLHVPNFILGILVYRWSAWGLFLCFAILNAGLGAAALLKRSWAVDALIALSSFNVVNTLLLWVSPARGEYIDAVMRQETAGLQTLPPGVNPDAISSFVRAIFPIVLGAGLVFAVVILYFLITRRKAYRQACRPVSPPPPVTPSVTSPGTQTGA